MKRFDENIIGFYKDLSHFQFIKLLNTGRLKQFTERLNLSMF